jgi:hypothetical protein
MDFGLFKELGIISVVAIPLFFLIKWIAEEFKEQLKRAHEFNMQATQRLNEICKVIERHDEKAEERGKYVREEHRQMIETLGRINGYKDHA